MIKILVLILFSFFCATAQAATYHYVFLKTVLLQNGMVLIEIHYTDSAGIDEIVFPLVAAKDIQNNGVVAAAADKLVQNILDKRTMKKSGIKNDPEFKANPRQRIITINE